MRLLAAAFLVAALALPTAASAGAPRDRVTGGGQILFAMQGAGNTIAFTAQGDEEVAKGQIQYITREAGNGQAQVRKHYVVECVAVESADDSQGVAYVRAHLRDDDTDKIGLYVIDNGEGAMASNDIVTVTTVSDDSDAPCNVDVPDDGEETTLGRGNAQTYDADA